MFIAWDCYLIFPFRFCPPLHVYSLGLLCDISFQILSSSTSVQVSNIHGTRGMIIGYFNSTRVEHFVATKLIRKSNVSSTATVDTTEMPLSHQNVTKMMMMITFITFNSSLVPLFEGL